MRTHRPWRLIWRFLIDEAGWIIATYVNAIVILGLIWLLLTFEGRSAATVVANLGYALLISSIVLLITLSIRFLRWYPFALQSQVLLEEEAGLDQLTSLPPGGDSSQEVYRTLIDRFYRLQVADRQRYQEGYQRHLAFINLWVHQMKTPVSTISLIAQQAESQEPEQVAASMDSVLEETVKLADGLELVLNTARLQDFAVDYQIRQVDLLEIVRKVINGRKKQFIRYGIFPEIDAPDGDWRVLTDEKWNSFAIDQVVANALKYGSQGGPAGQRLRFRLERGEQEIRLRVADQGPGIPEQDLGRVFEPFFTGENGRRYGGATGIGLYLVRQVMEQMGHTVNIASSTEEGKGTTVTFAYASSVTAGTPAT